MITLELVLGINIEEAANPQDIEIASKDRSVSDIIDRLLRTYVCMYVCMYVFVVFSISKVFLEGS